MNSRPRLKQAYDHHQRLLELMETKWLMEDLQTWAKQIPTEVDEFLAVGDIIDIFDEQLCGFLALNEKLPNNYQFAIQGVCDAIKDMPHCIFDVMRGRCIFSITHDTIEENGELQRYGIKSSRLIEKINKISKISGRNENMDSNDKIKSVGINIQEKANLIWNVANSLFGAYKPHEYGLVILPMVVIKRFHDCLLPTREKVLTIYEKVKQLAVKDGFLRSASGYRFYNTSQYTFDRLKADPENIKANFEAYINGFSDNVIDILANMGFFTQIERMADAGVLYQVISDFTADNADMNPEKSLQLIWAMCLKTLFSVFLRVMMKKLVHTSPAVILYI